MINLQINSLLSFHSPIFHSKIHKRRRTLFQRREFGGRMVNSLKRTYVEGVHVKRTGTNKGGEGQILEVLSKRTL